VREAPGGGRASLEDPQRRAGREAVEVGVGMQERRASSDARSGDQAIERISNGHALAPGGAVEARCQCEVVEALEPQDREGAKMAPDELGLLVGAESRSVGGGA
jgi:hypothetical protein